MSDQTEKIIITLTIDRGGNPTFDRQGFIFALKQEIRQMLYPYSCKIDILDMDADIVIESL